MITLLQIVKLNFVGFFEKFRIEKYNKVTLLQSVTGSYYKVRQVLQSVTVITKWDVTAAQKWSFLLSMSLVKVNKFAANCNLPKTP